MGDEEVSWPASDGVDSRSTRRPRSSTRRRRTSSTTRTGSSDLKSVDVLERDGDGRPLEVEFRAAAFGRSTTYTLRYDYSRAPDELAWHQIAR